MTRWVDPLRFILTGGEKAACQSDQSLLEGQNAGAVVGLTRVTDSNAIRAFIAAAKMQAVIPSRSNRTEHIAHDKQPYKERNLIERCFGKLKMHQRIATRFDRNDSRFMGFIFLAAALLWMQLNVDSR